MDLTDDLDDPFASSRRGGARPFASRFQPNIKGKVKPEVPAPSPPIPIAVKKDEEEEEHVAVVKEEELIDDDAVEPASDPMVVDYPDEEGDRLVREMDVFFTPATVDEDSLLYVLQYPLKPSWRPYELNERCCEVRVKPNQSKVEVDLNMDVHSDNYDPDVAENLCIQKQTLSSSKVPLSTEYAVGIMIGNQLHLNPVHAVVQLHSSMAHVSGVKNRKQSGHIQEVSTGEENMASSLKSSNRQREKKVSEESNEALDDAEVWVPLEYHAADSLLSGRYQQKMVAEGNEHIKFTMTLSDFVNSLCPGTSSSRIVKNPPKRVFESMLLEDRLKKWLTEVSHVCRFSALMHICPVDSNEEVLEVLQRHADLVQGLWVPKSSLLCEGREAQVRDYILFLFSKNRVINKNKLKAVRISDDSLRKILRPLAKERHVLNDWKFKVDSDVSFKKQFPHIVEEQNCAWSDREKVIMDSLHAPPVMTKKPILHNMVKRVNINSKS